MHTPLLTFVLVIFASLGKCGLDQATPLAQGSEASTCQSDAQCSSSVAPSFCHPQLKRCAAKTVSLYSYSLEVILSGGARNGATQFGPFSTISETAGVFVQGESDKNINQQLSLLLPKRVATKGTVRHGETPIDARLTFKRMDGIAGASSQEIFTSTIPYNGEARSHDFEIALEPSTPYEVTIIPQNSFESQLPPQTFLWNASGSHPVDDTITVQYNTLELTELKGRVENWVGEPIVGSPVYAVDVSGERVISTIGTTQSQGQYTLYIPSTFTHYLLRIAQSNQTHAVVTLDPNDLFPDSEGNTLLRVDSNVYPEQTWTFTAPSEMGSLDVWITDAAQRFGSKRTYEATVEGDRATLAISLSPGNYLVQLVPDGTLQSGMLATSVRVGNDGSHSQSHFVLPSRIQSVWNMFNPEGNELLSTQLFVSRRPTQDATALPFLFERNTIITQEVFNSVYLEPGTYDTVLTSRDHVKVMSFDIAPNAPPTVFDVRMGYPFFATGILNEGNTPIANADVIARLIHTNGANPQPNGLYLSQTKTNAEGYFILPLPAELP